MRIAVVCLVALSLAGCGGDSSQAFTAEEVRDVMTEPVRETLHAGMTMDPLACVEDGDPEHWECITTVIDKDEQRYSIVVAITCDPTSGDCISKPYDFVPLP